MLSSIHKILKCIVFHLWGNCMDIWGYRRTGLKCAVPRWMTFNVVFKSWEMLWLVQNTLWKLRCVDTVQLCLICGITPDVCLTKALSQICWIITFGKWRRKQVKLSSEDLVIQTLWTLQDQTKIVWFWPIRNCLSCLSWSSPQERKTCQESWKIALSNCPQASADNFNRKLKFWFL